MSFHRYLSKSKRTECYYCGTHLHFLNRSRDHIIPVDMINDGMEVPLKNYVFACKSCNNLKGNFTLSEWHTRVIMKAANCRRGGNVARALYFERIAQSLSYKSFSE